MISFALHYFLWSSTICSRLSEIEYRYWSFLVTHDRAYLSRIAMAAAHVPLHRHGDAIRYSTAGLALALLWCCHGAVMAL